MPVGSDSPFGDLIGQVVRAGAAIKGLNATFDGLSKAVSSVATAITGKLLDALGQFAGGIAKATVGLAAIGAAALPGGFKALGDVIDYLTAVIGSVGVPIFAVLAATALTLADTFKNQLLNAARTLAMWLAERLVPAIQTVAGIFDVIGQGISTAMSLFKYMLLSVAEVGLRVAKVLLELAAKIPGSGLLGVGAWVGKVQQKIDDISALRADALKATAGGAGTLAAKIVGVAVPGVGGAGGPGADFGRKFVDNFENIVKSLQLSMGKAGNVGFSGLLDVWKQVQMQSFVSPIEREKLARWAENIQLLKDMLKELRKDPALAIGR